MSTHAIDVTSAIDPLVSGYSMTVPPQASTVSNCYTEFYLVIAYTLPSASLVNVDVWFNDQDAAGAITI